jgi:hypothetical protein
MLVVAQTSTPGDIPGVQLGVLSPRLGRSSGTAGRFLHNEPLPDQLPSTLKVEPREERGTKDTVAIERCSWGKAWTPSPSGVQTSTTAAWVPLALALGNRWGPLVGSK